MQEIIRRCDMPVKTRGETAPHGVLVEGEPLRFTVGTDSYEIDLCDEHRDAFTKVLTPFMSGATTMAASREPNQQAVRRALKGKKGAFTTKDVRKWLTEMGRDVAPSGRLPNELIEEYRQAHAS